jgi:hypothetical protein
MVEVPASFPDGREAEGEFKTVSLKDYWRWSIGLPGEERLLTDEEMRGAGLLVEVDGETYHLIHAPDMGLKADEHGRPLQILTDIVAARGKCVPDDIGTDADKNPNWVRALQLLGGWLPGRLLVHAGSEGAIDMSGACVPDIHLSGLKVGRLNCIRSLFNGKANFSSATFRGEASFFEATFSGSAAFTSATFGSKAFFGWVRFNRESSFRGVTFDNEATFKETVFNGPAYFEGATFNRTALFRHSTFVSGAYYQRSHFGSAANFLHATFGSRTDFFGVAFDSVANFSSATFTGVTVFKEAQFRGLTAFRKAIFNGEAIFSEATFNDRANFESAAFNEVWSFSFTTFESFVSFRDVIRSAMTSVNAFRGAWFKDRFVFQLALADADYCVSALNEAHFEKPPSLGSSWDAEHIGFETIRQTKHLIRQIKGEQAQRRGSREEYLGPTPFQLLVALEGGFRTLKNAAADRGDFLEFQDYYRYELKTRVLGPRAAIWEKVAASLYGLSSYYGNSIARPFVSLAVILAGFAAIYLALAIEMNLVDWQDRAALQYGIFESVDFSLKNVFRPLSALSTDAPREGDASSLAGKLLNNYGKGFGLIVTAISIVQSLTGIVLAFLFGLAVRRRFQIS